MSSANVSDSQGIGDNEMPWVKKEDESSKRDDNNKIEDILYVRGSSFTIHLEAQMKNASTNETRNSMAMDEETNEIPEEKLARQSTSWVTTLLHVNFNCSATTTLLLSPP